MKYLTLHPATEDYNKLVLDESNVPHVAFVQELNKVYYFKGNSSVPVGYESFSIGDGDLYDSEGNKFCVKIN